MTIQPADGLVEVTLTSNDDPTRAQMLSRRVNDIRSTVIEADAPIDTNTAAMFDRRNHASQTDVDSASGIKGGGLQTQD